MDINYKILYEDFSGVKSRPKTLSLTNVNGVVVLYYLPTMSTLTTKIYRQIVGTDTGYYYIGKLEPDSNTSFTFGSGVFVDDNLPKGALLGSTDPLKEVHESWVIYSETDYSDWYKWVNTIPYNEGDGQQITGFTTIEGCLVVFKEHSIIREVWQGKNPPNSQRSDVNTQIGCIAPLTLININDNAYFLSMEGLWVYNNNTVAPVDKVFNQELKKVFQGAGEDLKRKILDKLRDASCGYNPVYNELYLNIPPLKTDDYQEDVGYLEYYNHIEGDTTKSFIEEFFGHVYVVSLNKGYVTKFGYQSTVQNRLFDVDHEEQDTTVRLKEVIDPSQMIRMYFTNSNNELRSADILPIKYNNDTKDFTVALMYIETPYARTESILYPDEKNGLTKDIIYRATDDILDVTDAPYFVNGIMTYYPPYKLVPVKTIWKSKWFTGGVEHIVKRIREVIVNIFSEGEITIRGISMPYETYDASINDSFYTSGQQYSYNPSVDAIQPVTNAVLKGTNRNVLYFVPQNPLSTVQRTTRPNDFLGKPLKFSVEIESELRTRLNSIVVKMRPINI